MYKKILLFLFMVILLVGTVSAMEWDNVKDYNPDLKEVTITNALGLGDTIAKIRLDSPIHNKVGLGYQKVFEMSFETYDDYENALQKMEFYNIRENMDAVQVDVDLKYLYTRIEEVPNMELECSIQKVEEFSGVWNDKNVCEWIQNGTKFEEVSTWEDYNGKDMLKGNITISGWTTTEQGDYIEWIPTYFGEEINEWADWKADLNTDLIGVYDFEEEDTTGTGTIYDTLGNQNATNDGADNSTGKIGYAYNYVLANTDKMANFTDFDWDTDNYTMNVWVNPDTLAGTDYGFISQNDGAGDYWSLIYRNAGSDLLSVQANCDSFQILTNDAVALNSGQWSMLTFTKEGTNVSIFVNGSLEYTGTTTVTAGCSDTDMETGWMTSGNWFDGKLDMFYIWDRILSYDDITYIYNSGDGMIYSLDNSPTVTLNSPTAYQNLTSQDVTFNCTVTDDNGITNVSLYINSSLNQTNTSQVNGTYIFTEELPDGYWNWTCEGYDDNSQQTMPTSTFFTVDTINPTIALSSPNGSTYDYFAIDDNVTINATITDTHLDSCWYDFMGTNTSLNCTTGLGNLTIDAYNDWKNITIWANDTFGNIHSNSSTWDYRLLFIEETYSASVLEGSTNAFSIKYITNGSSVNLGNLSYNDTANYGAISTSGNNYTITESITAPSVTADTNLSFYWNVSLNDGYYYAKTSKNQTVLNFNVDNCSVYNTTAILYNFTIVDEQTQVELNETPATLNTTGDINLQIYDLARTTSFINYTASNDDVNPFGVCLSNNLSGGDTYSIDVQVQYGDGGNQYAYEYYHIQNDTLTSADIPTNITLYDLNDSFAQEFKVTFKDENFLPVDDALIIIQRKYIDEGIFKTVEIAKTDTDGVTLVHLQLSDVIYTIVVQKNGEVLATFSNVIALCNNVATGDCEINLNSFGSIVDVENFNYVEGLTFTLSYNDTTRVVSSVFSTQSGTPETMNLFVTKNDNFGTTNVCNDTAYSASGTLTCTVPVSFGNETIRADLKKGTTLVGYSIIQLDEKPTDIYAGSYIFMNIIILTTLFGAGISGSIVLTAVFMVVAVIVAVGLHLMTGNFIGSGASFLMAIVAIAIIIWKATRKEAQYT